MDEMAGRAGVVTGGAQGIGLAIATALVREGAAVVLADLDLDTATASAEALTAAGPGKAIACACDVTSEEQVAAAVTRVHRRLRQPGLLGQQRRHHARQDAAQHEPRRLPAGHRHPSGRRLARHPRRRGGDARAGPRRDGQHLVHQRQGRQSRADELLGGEGRAHRSDQGGRERAWRAMGSGSTPCSRG